MSTSVRPAEQAAGIELPRRTVASWGNVARGEHRMMRPSSRFDSLPELSGAPSLLPFGNGRSYGDSCLNTDGALLCMRGLDRFMSFDRATGVLVCECGVLLDEILRLIVPQGWFLPVVPGTRFVTVGGAIANDVHGKNHHRAGTFGCNVGSFELLRSTGDRLTCSPMQNAEWFKATIGGLGLTGMITWAELPLRRIAGPWMDVESVRFENLQEFFALIEEADDTHEYTVAWVDCVARGRSLGRGLLQRANHSLERGPAPARTVRLGIPLMLPVSLVSPLVVRVFNAARFRSQRAKVRRVRQDLHSFFFPLDGIRNWNRLYGRNGFYQYQCVVPGRACDAIAELLAVIAHSGQASALAVLKRFGPIASPGMMSFPRVGYTLALDFPNRSRRLPDLFTRLDAIVEAAGGRLYPAKDSRMPAQLFHAGYPRSQEFAAYIDPRCSSNFWRRVTQAQADQMQRSRRREERSALGNRIETGA